MGYGPHKPWRCVESTPFRQIPAWGWQHIISECFLPWSDCSASLEFSWKKKRENPSFLVWMLIQMFLCSHSCFLRNPGGLGTLYIVQYPNQHPHKYHHSLIKLPKFCKGFYETIDSEFLVQGISSILNFHACIGTDSNRTGHLHRKEERYW